MINIFDNKSSTVTRKNKSKSNSADSFEACKEKLSNLNPMAFAIMAIKAQENPNNEFLKSSAKALSENPRVLTEKWINSINKFVDSTIKSALLDPPPYKEGSRVTLDGLVVSKIVDPKQDAEYPMPAIICVDKRGWKFYFKTSKAYNYSAGNTIALVATISSHKEGITFLRRPSKIVVSEKLF